VSAPVRVYGPIARTAGGYVVDVSVDGTPGVTTARIVQDPTRPTKHRWVATVDDGTEHTGSTRGAAITAVTEHLAAQTLLV